MDNTKHASMMMIVITEGRERERAGRKKRTGFGLIKKISWPINTQKKCNVLYAVTQKRMMFAPEGYT